MDKDWQEIIDYLQGTCKGLYEVLYEFGRLDLEDHLPFLDELDNQIFLCSCCGWWCEIGEAEAHPDYVEDICADCYMEAEEASIVDAEIEESEEL